MESVDTRDLKSLDCIVMRVRVPPVLPIGDIMYENPYKFAVGDLVSWAKTERTTHHGIITKKRRQSYYVEARPIKCVEEDQYLVVVGDGAGHWVHSDDLERSQKSTWEWQEVRNE